MILGIPTWHQAEFGPSATHLDYIERPSLVDLMNLLSGWEKEIPRYDVHISILSRPTSSSVRFPSIIVYMNIKLCIIKQGHPSIRSTHQLYDTECQIPDCLNWRTVIPCTLCSQPPPKCRAPPRATEELKLLYQCNITSLYARIHNHIRTGLFYLQYSHTPLDHLGVIPIIIISFTSFKTCHRTSFS